MKELLEILPKEKTPEGIDLYFLHEGFWYPFGHVIHGIISFQQHFNAQDTDLILVSIPKLGTTWLKALSFTIANRAKYPLLNESPLLTLMALFLSLRMTYMGRTQSPTLQTFLAREFSQPTRHTLPCLIPCRVVYLCRNPLDQFVSLSHFRANRMLKPFDPSLMSEGFDMLCRGVSAYGPFWDHVLGYWKASQERPDKVLFLKYEDMKEEDTFTNLKVLAEFMGFPFSVEEEESQGMIEKILRLCSFDHLKDLEVNKTEKNYVGHPNSAFFSKGEVGDWANHLTPSMADRI